MEDLHFDPYIKRCRPSSFIVVQPPPLSLFDLLLHCRSTCPPYILWNLVRSCCFFPYTDHPSQVTLGWHRHLKEEKTTSSPHKAFSCWRQDCNSNPIKGSAIVGTMPTNRISIFSQHFGCWKEQDMLLEYDSEGRLERQSCNLHENLKFARKPQVFLWWPGLRDG